MQPKKVMLYFHLLKKEKRKKKWNDKKSGHEDGDMRVNY